MTDFSFRSAISSVFRSKIARKKVDEKFYLALYRDVAESGMSAIEHYWNYGWREGRNPSPKFHTLYYASKNMPGGELSSQPLLHYLETSPAKHGEIATAPENPDEWTLLQKKKAALFFDAQFYRRKYGNRLGGIEPIDHYFAVGWENGFDPREDFSTESYLKMHSYILASDVNPFYHFVVVGKGEASDLADRASSVTRFFHSSDEETAYKRAQVLRAIAPHFDGQYYCTENPDVAMAGVNPLQHYVDYGWREGRNPSPMFWTRYYLTRYPEVAAAGANPLYHYLTHGQEHGFQPNPLGTKKWRRPVAPANEDWSKASPAVSDDDLQVTVVMPVYKGYDDTLAAIHSVLTCPQKNKFDLIVVNDKSPEAELTEALRELARRNLFIYVENEENLGFVRTVNKALKMRPKNNVILLNADTLVYGNWIDRLLQQAKDDPKAATITPLSNNASICSYPDTNRDNVLALECSREQLDLYTSVCNSGRSTSLPTGVGFCFYMRRTVIDEIGDFDLVFGRGYGEENDFCMRALKAGYKNLLAQDIFVYHSGQVSFKDFRLEEYGPGQRALSIKHPDYVRRVEAFIEANPTEEARIRLDLYRLSRHIGPSCAVFITIDSAGGIVTHVNDLAQRLEESGAPVILLSVLGDMVSIRPFDRTREIYTPSLKPLDIVSNISLIAEFLNWLSPKIIHVHSFALLKWRPTQLMMAALAENAERLFVTLHDYDSICHRHHLVNREGQYCESVDLAVCTTCVRTDSSAIDKVDPAERQARYHAFLTQAKKVFVPSEDARTRVSSYFPGIEFTVREHEESLPSHRFLRPRASSSPLHVAAIGALGPHKGCDIVYSLALDAKLRSLPIRYSIVGYSAISAKMREVGVTETGRYSSARECMEEIENLNADFALFPSIWPETYCYTLSIALALGLPPLVFDLGAQAERVRRAGYGVVFDYSLMLRPEALNDAIIQLSVNDEWAKRGAVEFRQYGNLQGSYYGLEDEDRSKTLDVVT